MPLAVLAHTRLSAVFFPASQQPRTLVCCSLHDGMTKGHKSLIGPPWARAGHACPHLPRRAQACPRLPMLTVLSQEGLTAHACPRWQSSLKRGWRLTLTVFSQEQKIGHLSSWEGVKQIMFHRGGLRRTHFTVLRIPAQHRSEFVSFDVELGFVKPWNESSSVLLGETLFVWLPLYY